MVKNKKVLLPISVVIPVYNRPKLIIEAITSVLKGSFLPNEIIIVCYKINLNDDTQNHDFTSEVLINFFSNTNNIINNSNNHINIAKNFFSNANNFFSKFQAGEVKNKIVFIDEKNVSKSRNLGVKFATNEYIAFLDSDDLWLKKKLEYQWHYLEKRPYLEVLHTNDYWMLNGKFINKPKFLEARRGNFLISSFYNCLVSCSTLLIKKKFFEKIGGFDETFNVCEDFDLFINILLDNPIGLINEKLTIKRSGAWEQLSKTILKDEQRVRSLINFYEKNKSLISYKIKGELKNAITQKINIILKGAKKYNNKLLLSKYEHILIKYL